MPGEARRERNKTIDGPGVHHVCSDFQSAIMYRAISIDIFLLLLLFDFLSLGGSLPGVCLHVCEFRNHAVFFGERLSHLYCAHPY